MIEPSIYCKVAGMAMRCIAQLNSEGRRLPTVVEVGCADGQGTMRYAGFCSSVIAIDPMMGGRPDIVSKTREDLPIDQGKLDEFTRRNRDFNVTLIIGCSLWPEVLEQTRSRLPPEGADIVIIDGCHHPHEAVWADVEAYYPLVRPGGFMVIDDLYEDDIVRAWDRAKSEFGMIEFDRWGIRTSEILQEPGALRKPLDP